jgi:hypothetical protein
MLQAPYGRGHIFDFELSSEELHHVGRLLIGMTSHSSFLSLLLKFYSWNIHMPAVKFSSRLDLEPKFSFFNTP